MNGLLKVDSDQRKLLDFLMQRFLAFCLHSSTQLKSIYWPIPGICEPIRYMLSLYAAKYLPMRGKRRTIWVVAANSWQIGAVHRYPLLLFQSFCTPRYRILSRPVKQVNIHSEIYSFLTRVEYIYSQEYNPGFIMNTRT